MAAAVAGTSARLSMAQGNASNTLNYTALYEPCPGAYCGRLLAPDGTSLMRAQCGACPTGTRSNGYVCVACTGNGTVYQWCADQTAGRSARPGGPRAGSADHLGGGRRCRRLYLLFAVICVGLMHAIALSTRTPRDGTAARAVRLQLACAGVELLLAALVCLLLWPPSGSLALYMCPVTSLSDWYTMLSNPTIDFTVSLDCTQEAVSPLYTIVPGYILLCAVFMVVLRPFVVCYWCGGVGLDAIYAALWGAPVLTVVFLIAGGLLCASRGQASGSVRTAANRVRVCRFCIPLSRHRSGAAADRGAAGSGQAVQHHASAPRGTAGNLLCTHGLRRRSAGRVLRCAAAVTDVRYRRSCRSPGTTATVLRHAPLDVNGMDPALSLRLTLLSLQQSQEVILVGALSTDVAVAVALGVDRAVVVGVRCDALQHFVRNALRADPDVVRYGAWLVLRNGRRLWRRPDVRERRARTKNDEILAWLPRGAVWPPLRRRAVSVSRVGRCALHAALCSPQWVRRGSCF